MIFDKVVHDRLETHRLIFQRSLTATEPLTLDHKCGHFFKQLLYKNINTMVCNFLHTRAFSHNAITKMCNFLYVHFWFTQVYIFMHTFVRMYPSKDSDGKN